MASKLTLILLLDGTSTLALEVYRRELHRLDGSRAYSIFVCLKAIARSYGNVGDAVDGRRDL